MATFDEPERDRWARAADEHLQAARHASGGDFHSAAVLHASSPRSAR